MATRALASWKVKNAERQVAQRAKAHSHKHSREIDHRIKEDSKSSQRVYNILVMGSSVSANYFTLCQDCVEKIVFASYSEFANKYCVYRYADVPSNKLTSVFH